MALENLNSDGDIRKRQHNPPAKHNGQWMAGEMLFSKMPLFLCHVEPMSNSFIKRQKKKNNNIDLTLTLDL